MQILKRKKSFFSRPYLASVYLIGESEEPVLRNSYIKRAKITNIVLLAAGSIVFLLAEVSHHHLFRTFFTNPVSIGCFVFATVMTGMFWHKILQPKVADWDIRFVAGFQVSLVLLAWVAIIFPNVLFYTNGEKLSLFAAAAPAATIAILAWSLLLGALMFLPVLFYLLRIFKTKEISNHHSQ